MVRGGGEMDGSAADDVHPRRPLQIRVGHAALVLLLCGVACILVLRWHWRHEFHQRIEAIRAAGYPATLEELDAWYKRPEAGANAADWILGAAAVHQKPPEDDWRSLQRIIFSQDSERPDLAQPLASDLMDLLEQYIRANDAALESLHEASTIEECRYPIDLSNTNFVVSHGYAVRDGVMLLCLEAVLWAERGDFEAAVHAITTALHVADSLDKEPVMLSRLLRMVGLRSVAVTLERILNRVELTDRQIETLRGAFRDLDIRGGLSRALAGERCSGRVLFDHPESADPSMFKDLPPVPVLEAYGALGLAAREGTIYLDFAQECIRIASLPVSQHRVAIEAAEARHLHGGKGILLSYAWQASAIMNREAFYVASWEIARVSLAVELYRRVHGELPERLEYLVPDGLAAAPEDSFDGMPLRYRRLDRGYMVYSVGQDGKDDGGKPEPPKDAKAVNETWDLVFRVQR